MFSRITAYCQRFAFRKFSTESSASEPIKDSASKQNWLQNLISANKEVAAIAGIGLLVSAYSSHKISDVQVSVKNDLLASEARMKGDLLASESRMKGDLVASEARLKGDLNIMKGDLNTMKEDMKSDAVAVENRVRNEIAASESRVLKRIDEVLVALQPK